MIDLQLVGYTADLKHLVFDLDGGSGEGRYRLFIDADLFATMDTVRDSRREEGLPVGDEREYEWDDWEDGDDWEDEASDEASEGDDEAPGAWLTDDEPDDEEPGVAADESDDEQPEVPADEADDEEPGVPADEPDDEQPGVPADEPDDEAEELDEPASPEPDDDRADETTTHVVDAEEPEPDPASEIRARAARPGLDARTGDGPTLSPLEIQGLLRQGKSVRTVAKSANTTVEWVNNWLGPIEAEREQILRAARRIRLERARLGHSREAMGAAVERNVRGKGVDPGDVTWEAVRRKDGRWRVSASYVHRRRRTKASWLYDPAEGTLEAANDPGNELGFVRRKQRA